MILIRLLLLVQRGSILMINLNPSKPLQHNSNSTLVISTRIIIYGNKYSKWGRDFPRIWNQMKIEKYFLPSRLIFWESFKCLERANNQMTNQQQRYFLSHYLCICFLLLFFKVIIFFLYKNTFSLIMFIRTYIENTLLSNEV